MKTLKFASGQTLTAPEQIAKEFELAMKDPKAAAVITVNRLLSGFNGSIKN